MGRLAGIARHDRKFGPMEPLDAVLVTRERGIAGDIRGAVPGRRRRQVSLISGEGWAAALAQLVLEPGEAIPWYMRRANLLTEGLDLPREPGRIIAIGDTLRIMVTMECDPCSRMDDIRPGLRVALEPDWRGGVLGTVIDDGEIAVGDEVRIEQ